MVCEDCLTIFYSAAARTLVERGERCPKCDGRLILDEEDPLPPPLSVVGGGQGRHGEDRRIGDRRMGERRTGDRRRRPGGLSTA